MGKDYTKIISANKAMAKEVMTSEQFQKCQLTIRTASIASGIAGVSPIPGTDVVPISAAQIGMVVNLGKIFGKDITLDTAKTIISATAATLIGRNLVKCIPVIGWGISAVVAAGLTEAIGWAIAVEMTQIEEKIAKLQAEIQPFLDGKKFAQKDYPLDYAEYKSLLKESEEILENLPAGHPFRETYDKFVELGVL